MNLDLVDEKNYKAVLEKLDYIVTSLDSKKKKLELKDVADHLKANVDYVAGVLARTSQKKLRIVSPDFISDSLVAGKVQDFDQYLIPMSPHKFKKSSSNTENLDKVVELKDIMGEVYDIKFGKKRKDPSGSLEEEKVDKRKGKKGV